MLLSRANLSCAEVALKTADDPVLHQLRVEPDGSTVASDGRSLLAVSPVTERPKAWPDFEGEEAAHEVVAAEGGIGLLPDNVGRALRDMPRGALGLELGFAAVTACDAGEGGVKMTTTDLNRHLSVEGRKARKKFPLWKEPLREARGEVRARVCVDRRALVRLLRAIDAAAPDPENTVFLEVGTEGGLVLRARNASTGQSVVGLAMGVNTRGQWLPLSPWEEEVLAPAKEATGKKIPRRK